MNTYNKLNLGGSGQCPLRFIPKAWDLIDLKQKSIFRGITVKNVPKIEYITPKIYGESCFQTPTLPLPSLLFWVGSCYTTQC